MDTQNKTEEFQTVLNITDDELLRRWSATFSKYGSAPDDVRTEVLRRATLRVFCSAKRLERLTIGLIVLTVALLIVAIPPAVEAVLRWFGF